MTSRHPCNQAIDDLLRAAVGAVGIDAQTQVGFDARKKVKAARGKVIQATRYHGGDAKRWQHGATKRAVIEALDGLRSRAPATFDRPRQDSWQLAISAAIKAVEEIDKPEPPRRSGLPQRRLGRAG